MDEQMLEAHSIQPDRQAWRRSANRVLGQLVVGIGLSLVLCLFALISGARADPAVLSTRIVKAYSLSPALEKKANAHGQFRRRTEFAGLALQILIPLILLRLGFSARFRDWAERVSPKRWVQAWIYGPLLIIGIGVLTLLSRPRYPTTVSSHISDDT